MAMTYKVTLTTEDGERLNSWTLSLFARVPGTLNVLRQSDRNLLMDGICDEIAAQEQTLAEDEE